MQFILRELFQDYTHTNFRSSHRSCSVEKSVLKKLLRAKRLCWSPFCWSRFKPETCNFIKKKPYHWCFPTNIAKFLRTHTLTNIFEQSILISVHICTSFFMKYHWYDNSFLFSFSNQRFWYNKKIFLFLSFGNWTNVEISKKNLMFIS